MTELQKGELTFIGQVGWEQPLTLQFNWQNTNGLLFGAKFFVEFNDSGTLYQITPSGSYEGITNAKIYASSFYNTDFTIGELVGSLDLINSDGNIVISTPIDVELTSVYTAELGRDYLGTDNSERIIGDNDDNIILGFEGDDILIGHEGNDTLIATAGNNNIYGGEGNDTLIANDGQDDLFGGSGNDKIIAGGGFDRVYGGDGNDILRGHSGNDILRGENDDDLLEGGEGNDQLHGGNGNDTLIGGSGSDFLYGNAGIDTFVFNEVDLSFDKVMDFSFEYDLLDFSGALAETDWDGTTATLSDYVKITHAGTSFTYIGIDMDGLGVNYQNNHQVRISQNTQWQNANDIYDNGNLIV